MSNGKPCEDVYLWLEVANVRMDGGSSPRVRVQLKGDRSDKEPTWLEVDPKAYGGDESDTAREIFSALDKKRIVLAGIGINAREKDKLVVKYIRIQLNDSGSR